MYEKVNPQHPDKIADRIAGALVDLAYQHTDKPRIAVEVLIGHGYCNIIAETSVKLDDEKVLAAVKRIAQDEDVMIEYIERKQDEILADNQADEIRCGDNGIFKGRPTTDEQKKLARIAGNIYAACPHDGKYIIDGRDVIVCQSNTNDETDAEIRRWVRPTAYNPLGRWTGGTDVDTGATNRKLGSDMGDAVTGGGLHGKDLSKADVSINIYLHLLAHQRNRKVEASCAIGDDMVDVRYDNGTSVKIPYTAIVAEAREYIRTLGGFEALAEWGLIRP